MYRNAVPAVPLSKLAETKLADISGDYWVCFILIFLIGGAFSLFAGLIGDNSGASSAHYDYAPTISSDSRFVTWFLWVFVVSVGGGELIFSLHHLTTSHSRRKEILQRNVVDYAQAECLKTQILPRFAGTRSDEFPLREGEIGGSWRAFKVEHFASQSLRGDITGNICLNWQSFLKSGGGEVSAQLKQLSVPDLLDMSSVVFFENDQGRTLRVLVPSPRATKETIARLIEFYLGDGSYGSGVLERDTHTYEALGQFTTDESALITPISHPALLDRLDAATQKSRDARPEVQVTGEMVQEGVALATALTVEGRRNCFFPSGYLGELTSGLAFALDKDREPTNLLAAVA